MSQPGQAEKQPIVFLMGPTASGKTQLAVKLVQHFPFEIISVDSALVYRGMTIGTAKPDADTLRLAPHRLIDIRDPSAAYSAAQFRDDAVGEMADIVARGHIPLLVGGTMLYFRALQQGLSALPSADPILRASLYEEGERLGWPALHERLAHIDPVAAERIHAHDAQRIQRALEVFELTGKNISTWQQQEKSALPDYAIHSLAIAPQDRAVLHERIAKRFMLMLEEGLLDEVQALLARGDLTMDTPAMRSVGYRQAAEYLQHLSTYEVMCEKGIAATRQLAKRQLTWLRSWPDLTLFDSEAPDLYQQVVNYLQENMII